MKNRKKMTPQVVSTKPLRGAGSEPAVSAKIGGVSNSTKPNNLPNEKKGK